MKRRGKLYYLMSFIGIALSMKIIIIFNSNWNAIALCIMINVLFNVIWISFMNNKEEQNKKSS